MRADAPRYAIYFAPPPSSELWTFGSAVIGYDAASGRRLPSRVPRGVSVDDWMDLTSEQRRYGFHATLKAPFRLAPGREEGALLAAVDAWAAERSPVYVGRIAVSQISNFIALTAPGDAGAVSTFAADVVQTFDAFRAELSAAEQERRLASGLSTRQVELLDLFGYPYVLEQFRFHMTLTGRLPRAAAEMVKEQLTAGFNAIVCDQSATIEDLVIFRQLEPDAPFKILHRAPLSRLAQD